MLCVRNVLITIDALLASEYLIQYVADMMEYT